MTTLNTSIIKSLVDHTGDDTSIIPDGSVPILDVSGNLTVAGNTTIWSDVEVSKSLTVNSDGFFNRVFARKKTSSPGDIVLTLNGALDWHDASNDNARLKLEWHKNYGLRAHNIANGGTQVIAFGSQTITHQTNCDGEIGTFCETNGEIYDGYEKITETDCICQVVQSTTLNPKIVGVITGENQFASHGDVLMKVVPGTYHLGDILCPDITGLARIASETELQYMMLHAIPRPKITSLNTGIDGTVATFLI